MRALLGDKRELAKQLAALEKELKQRLDVHEADAFLKLDVFKASSCSWHGEFTVGKLGANLNSKAFASHGGQAEQAI
jgi:hypothetical protein